MISEDREKLQEQNLREILERLDKQEFGKYGESLSRERYNEREAKHLTATTAAATFVEFNSVVDTVTVFVVVGQTNMYIDLETDVDNGTTTTTSIPLQNTVGTFITIPIRTKRVYARTGSGTAELVVWGLR